MLHTLSSKVLTSKQYVLTTYSNLETRTRIYYKSLDAWVKIEIVIKTHFKVDVSFVSTIKIWTVYLKLRITTFSPNIIAIIMCYKVLRVK